MDAVDFDFWVKVPKWTPHEAVTLSLNADPRTIEREEGIDTYGFRYRVSESFERHYRDLYLLVSRASAVCDLPREPSPKSFIEWASRNDVDLPPALVSAAKKHGLDLTIQQPEQAADSAARPPATSQQIINAFQQVLNADENKKWWTTRFRDAGDYKLVQCRVQRGRNARVPSLWHPDGIAAWLIDKHEWPAKKAAEVLRKHFPEYRDQADLLDPPQ